MASKYLQLFDKKGEPGSYLGNTYYDDFKKPASTPKSVLSGEAEGGAWSEEGIFGSDGSKGMQQAILDKYLGKAKAANAALGNIGALGSAKLESNADRKVADIEASNREKDAKAGFWGSLAKTAATVGGALLACDERVKVEIAPLQTCDVDDRLSRLAWAVQGIRGCS